MRDTSGSSLTNLSQIITRPSITIGAVVLGLWLLYDLYRTNTRYGEDVLMSSREGEIEDEMVIEEPAALGGTP